MIRDFIIKKKHSSVKEAMSQLLLHISNLFEIEEYFLLIKLKNKVMQNRY